MYQASELSLFNYVDPVVVSAVTDIAQFDQLNIQSPDDVQVCVSLNKVSSGGRYTNTLPYDQLELMTEVTSQMRKLGLTKLREVILINPD